ncbi:MAG: hypothetical protein ACT4RN_22895 [Pseudonocardia sp.]
MLQARPAHGPRPAAGWPGVGKLALVALTWGFAALVVLATAAVTRVGPILYTINDRHGIHAFDVLVGTGMFCVALLVTAVIVWPRRRAY